MKVRVGILGFGLSGRYFHAPFLKAHKGFEIVAVSSSDREKVWAYLPGVRVHAAPEALVADPEVDLLVNCGPNSLHFSMSAAALRAGKHVVVEKPFVNSVAEARELINLAKACGRELVVFQNRRWDGDFLTLRGLLSRGGLGDWQHFESRFDVWKPIARPERWRERAGPGSGAWCDLGAHLVDQMLLLFGEPDAVSADIIPQRDGSVADDFFHVVFRYGARRAVLQSSRFSPVSPRFLVYGKAASFEKRGIDPQEAWLRDGGEPGDAGFGVERAGGRGVLVVGGVNAGAEAGSGVVEMVPGNYGEFYDGLHACLRGAGASPVSLASSLRVMELLEAARESARIGGLLRLEE